MAAVDPRFASVHADLDRIFAAAHHQQQAGSSGSKAPGAVDRGRARRRGVWAIGGAGAIALLGMGMALSGRSGRLTTPAGRVAAPRTARNGPPPTPPVIAAAPARPPAAPMPAMQPSPVAGSAALPERHAPVAEHRSGRHIPAPLPLAPAPARHDRAKTKLGFVPEPAKACAPTFEAWCLRDATATADRNLREAYRIAAEDGVDRATLQGIKRDWVRFRHQANKQPRELIRGFQMLTSKLQQLGWQKRQAAKAG